MIRLDARTVELSNAEIATWDVLHARLIRGESIPQAAVHALNWYRRRWGMPSADFIAYLSDSTCERSRRRVKVKREWR